MNASTPLDAPVPPSQRTVATRHKRRWLPYLGALLLLALIVAGFWPQPIPVELGQVTVGLLRASIDEEGKTRVRQRFVVSAPVTGRLRRIPFKAGAPVVAGQTVIAVLDPPPSPLLDPRTRLTAEARRAAAAANLEKARAAHAFAASELARFQKLYADKTISNQDWETAQWRETSAARDLAAAESALRQADAELARFDSLTSGQIGSETSSVEVKAPASGFILNVLEENERLVTAATPLVVIGDPADLEVVIEVLSREGAGVSPGTPVELDQWGGPGVLSARVRLVEPAAFTKVSALGVEEQRVRVVADLLTPPAQRANLGDNFRVEAHIVTWADPHALKVPAGALFRHGSQWRAFVLADGRARLRQVKVGRSSGTETQILEGLRPGESVIVYPGDRVQDGRRIRPIKV